MNGDSSQTARGLKGSGLLVLALLACVVTRVPAYRYDVISDDEAIYDAMAHTVSAGGVMYHDTVDHKPPGLTYSYAAMRALVGGVHAPADRVAHAVHTLGLLYALLTCLVLAGVARRAFPQTDAAGWAALSYAMASTIKQPVDGLAVNGELMLNLPTALGLLATLEAGSRKGLGRVVLDVLAGAFVAAATAYKYQGIAVAVALPLLWIARATSLRDRVSAALAGLASSAMGFLAVVGAITAYFASRGVLGDVVDWALLFNLKYISQGPSLAGALTRLCMQLVGVVLPGLLFYAAGTVGLIRIARARSEATLWLAPFTLLVFACVTLGGRFFGHYFVQLELCLALTGAPVLAQWATRAPRMVLAAWTAPAVAFFVIAIVPSVSQPILNADDPDYRKIGRAIQEITRPDDTVWVWGNVPQLYHTADRLSGARFTFCNYLTGLSPATPSEDDPKVLTKQSEVKKAWDLLAVDFATRPPMLVLDTAAAGYKSYGKYPVEHYPALASALAAKYRIAARIDGIVVWRRVD